MGQDLREKLGALPGREQGEVGSLPHRLIRRSENAPSTMFYHHTNRAPV
jgi:hypothetical protein